MVLSTKQIKHEAWNKVHAAATGAVKYQHFHADWWAYLDSNQGPTGYEPVALAN